MNPQTTRKILLSDIMSMKQYRILVIDDEIGKSEQTTFLRAVGYYPETGGKTAVSDYPYKFTFHTGQNHDNTNSVDAVKEEVLKGWPDAEGNRWALILLDIRFGDDETFGFELLQALREDSRFGEDLPVVVLTSEGEGKRARAGELNADGFLPKHDAQDRPFWSRSELEQRVLKFGLIPDDRPDALLKETNTKRLSGRSLPLLKVLREARQTAYALSNRILYGETGAGKSELGGYIHCFTGRNGKYVPWFADPNTKDLLKSQLFGWWEDTYTNADEPRAGKIEQAHRGTFFLDEVANLSIETQMAFMEFRKQDDQGFRTLSRLGIFPENGPKRAKAIKSLVAGPSSRLRDHRIKVDVFLITGTNKNLEDVTNREKLGFKEDFLNALGTPLRVPSLNNRREDIPELFLAFLARFINKPDREPKEFEIDAKVFELLNERDWSMRGNVRDLERIAEYAASKLGDFNKIQIRHLPDDVQEDATRLPTLVGNIESLFVSNPVPAATKAAIQQADEEYSGASEFTRADLNHLLRRVDLLEEVAEDTRDKDAAGNKTNLVPTRAVARLMGRKISSVDAKSIINDILGPILRTRKYWDAAYGEELVLAKRSYIESRPVLMELNDWASNRSKSPEK